MTAPTVAPAATTVAAPTSGEIMRGRISKAKGFIAVKNFNAAIYELENIRRETNDQTVHGVLNVLLMNCYLEQGDYKRAGDFLTTLFNDVKVNKPNAAANYYAAAGQVIKGARTQSERYKALGLMVSDRNLPPEAVTDLDNMRVTLEKLVEQSKTLGKDAKQTANAFALLEETTGARSLLARDDYDAKRWKDEVADSREMLASSRSTVMNAVNDSLPDMPVTAPNSPSANTVAANTTAATLAANTLPVPTSASNQTPAANAAKVEEKTPVFQPVTNPEPVAKVEKPTVREPEPKKADETPKNAPETSQPRRERRVASSEPAETTAAAAKTETGDPSAPLSVGSLLEFAVQKTAPVYPPTARTLRQTGVVRLEVVVDEEGRVATVQNSSGPTLLQSAAKDAVRKWKFKPFLRDGQPVKATGFLSFNFNL